jgi:hypothetical protein
MNAVRAVLNMHTRGKWLSFFWPCIGWSIHFCVSMFVMLIILLFGGTIAYYPGGIIAIMAIFFLAGMLILNDTFPFALGFGQRRTDYVLGTTVLAIMISAIAAIFWLLCSLLEIVTRGWGVSLYYFHLPYFSDGPLIEQFWVYFMMLANLFFLGFVIGSIYRRLGGVGTLIFFIIVFLLASSFSLVSTYLRWWGALFHWLSQYTAFELALWLLPLTALYLLVSYLLLRRAVA